MVRRPNPKWSYFSLWLGFYGFFGILVWNVTTVSCYCSIKKKIQADKWPLLSLNLRKCVDQGRWYIYIIRIWKILFISSPWREQDFRKKKSYKVTYLVVQWRCEKIRRKMNTLQPLRPLPQTNKLGRLKSVFAFPIY